jgi:GT2 family glycosyltransferase
MNPDIYFAEGTIEDIYRFMEDNSSIGMLMPKVLYPDGSLQHLCRLLPSPFILLVRKMNFPPFKSLAARKNQEYELRFADYNKIIEAPYLSGCFMFVRSEVFRKVGIFDERFFLYLEDVDLSRRISRFYKTLYYPQAVIYHGYRKGSYKNVLLLVHHISSAIKYFNKWGWFFDEERKGINNKTLCTLSKVI